MAWGILTGAAAGAAGTAALNAATYLDMAVRGRATSDAPEQVVARTAERAGVTIPGGSDERDNRLQGLGPLAGTLVGVTVGTAAGALHTALAKRGRHLPASVEVALITVAAMALTDAPMTLLGVSDPKTWAAKDWISDLVPHLAYGLTTYATIEAVHTHE